MLSLLTRHGDYLLLVAACVGVVGYLHVVTRRHSPRDRMFVIAWPLLALLLVVGWFCVEHADYMERTRLRDMLLGYAPTYAQELTLMGHGQLPLDAAADDPRYLAMIDAQIRWQRLNPSVSDIYTFRKRADGAVLLVVDSETDYDRNGVFEGDREVRTAIGAVYEYADARLDRAFSGRANFEPAPITDAWGTWVSAFAPMYDSNGRVEAVLGVDYPANDWQQAVSRVRLTVIVVLVILVAMLAAAIAVGVRLRGELQKRRAAESGLRQSESRTRQIIHYALDPIVLMDADGNILEWNPQCEATFGWTAEEVLGQRLCDRLVPERFRTAHQQGLVTYLRTRRSSLLNRRVETFALHKDGHEIPVELAIAPVPSKGRESFCGFVRDITDRRRMEKEWSTPNAMLEVIRRSLLSFICGTDSDMAMHTLLTDVLQLTDSEYGFIGEVLRQPDGQPFLRARAVTDISWDEQARALYAANADKGFDFLNLDTLFGAVLTTGRPVIANDVANDLRRDGLPEGHPPLRCFLGVPFFHAGELVGMFGLANRPGGYERKIVTDLQPVLTACGAIVAAIRNDARRRKAEQQLSEARATAEAANRTKSDFLANMSHEIRTPMTAILGFAEILTHESISAAERRTAVKSVRRNAEHLLQIINDILDLSKIEAGRMVVEIAEYAPQQIIDDAVLLVHPLASAKALPIDVRFAGPIPSYIHTDQIRLRQILVNLLSNAIKFTHKGRIQLCCSFVPGEQASLQFDVIDTGIGMSPEQVGKLFQPFTQSDSSITRRYGGTGLGLTIVQRLAHILGGNAKIVSTTPGSGTHVQVNVGTGALDGVQMIEPSGETQGKAPGDVVPVHNRTHGAASLAGVFVLVAEDGHDNQRLIELILRKAGATARVVENGQLAVEAALQAWRNGSPFDAILMDMQMPVMDGYQATRTLRDAGCQTPIIALTAHAMSHDRAQCLEVGCSDYMAKPVDRRILIELIQKYASATVAI